ncbi:MAG: heparinase II/III family protein [Lachnospiraceae bacterium]|nr:heparinase II/III family protein [Lachnospiraceae bacterium]
MKKIKYLFAASVIILLMLIPNSEVYAASKKIQLYQYNYSTNKQLKKEYKNNGTVSGLKFFGIMAVYPDNEKATFEWETTNGTGKIANVYGRSTNNRLATIIGLRKGTVKLKVTAKVGKKKVASATCKVRVTGTTLSTKPLSSLYEKGSKVTKLPTSSFVQKNFKKQSASHPRVLGDSADFRLAQKYITYAICRQEGFNTPYEKLVKKDIESNYSGAKVSDEYWQYLYDVNKYIIRDADKWKYTYKYKLSGGSLIDTVIKNAEDEITVNGYCYRMAVAYKENVESYKNEFKSSKEYSSAKSNAEKEVKSGRKRAARIISILDSLSKFKDWNPSHFLDVGEMSYIFGLGYDWTYDAMTKKQRDKYADILIKKGIEVGNQYLKSYPGQQRYKNNWSAVNFSGIGVASIAVFEKDPELCGKQIADASRFIPVFINQMAPEGGFSEGMTYWNLSWRFISYLTSSMKTTFGDDYGITDTDGAKQSMLFPIYMKSPISTAENFSTYNFGDTIISGKGIDASLIWMCDNYMDDGDFLNTSKIITWYKTTYTRRDRYSEANAQEMLWFPSLLSKCGTKLKAPSKVTDSDLKKWGLHENKTFFYSNKITDKMLAKYELVSDGVSFGKGERVNIITYGGSFTEKNSVYFATKDSNTNSAHRDMDAGSFIYDALGTRWVTDWGKVKYDSNRFKYYVKRAEGHSTIVINPSSEEDQNNSVEDGVSGTSVISKKDTKLNGKGGHIIYDMSNSYNVKKKSDGTLTRNKNSVKRGFKLLESGKRLLIQDEIQLDNASDIYWFLQTDINSGDFDISKDGKSVIMTKTNIDGKKVKLKAELKVTSNNKTVNPKFTTMKYETMSKELMKYAENKTFAKEHSGKRKLAIHVSSDKNGKTVKIKKCTIAVVLTPIYTDSDKNDKMPKIEPLKKWS